jgi:hypothetical protein
MFHRRREPASSVALQNPPSVRTFRREERTFRREERTFRREERTFRREDVDFAGSDASVSQLE